jgi:protein SCO1/2
MQSAAKAMMPPAAKAVILPQEKAEMLPEGKAVILPQGKAEMLPERKAVMLPEAKTVMLPEAKTVTLRAATAVMLRAATAVMLSAKRLARASMTSGARASMRARLFAAVAAVLLAGVVQAAPQPAVYDIHGHLPDLKFTLSGAQGRTVSQDDVKGKTVLLFFGYASCPDVCPTTMAQLADVMGRLGNEAGGVRILFVSVDPHRDTPDGLQAYVNAFNSNAIGLTGTERQIADIARRYRVSYQIDKPRPGADPNVYNVTHSRGVYVFDGRGEARLLLSDSSSTEQIVDALRKLAGETRR